MEENLEIIPKMGRKLTTENKIADKSEENGPEEDILNDIRQMHFLRDLWNTFWIKFRSIRKLYKEKEISQSQGLQQLFDFIFTLTTNFGPSHNSPTQKNKNNLLHLPNEVGYFDDKYLRVKWFLELLQIPKNVK